MKPVFDNMPLRRCLLAASASILFLAVAAAQEPTRAPAPPIDLPALLQRGLFEEEGRRRLDEAARAYEALLAGFDEQKHLAATALFRLAEVRRKQDRKDEAIALYQRLLVEFPAADPLARLSRENLAALGAPESQATPPATAATADASAADPAMSEEEVKELARVRALAETSPDLLNQSDIMPDSRGQPPIIVACLRGWTQVARFLLEKGAPVDVKGPDGTTPLAAAAEAGNKALCEWLLSQNASIKNNPSALTIAIGKGFRAVAILLLEAGADINAFGKIPTNQAQGTPLVAAIESGSDAMLDLVLARRPDVNRRPGPAYWTALHYACQKGNAPVVARLLDLGAEVNAVADSLRSARPAGNIAAAGASEEGSTPLHDAVIANAPECVALLLKAGAKTEVRDGAGYTPLFLTMLSGQPSSAVEIARLLLDAGADGGVAAAVRQQNGLPDSLLSVIQRLAMNDNDPVSALALAFRRSVRDKEFQEVVKALLAHGSDPAQTGIVGLASVVLDTPAGVTAAEMRLFRYQEMAARPEITLCLPEANWFLGLQRRGNSTEPPTKLADLLLNLSTDRQFSAPLDWKNGAIYRREKSGTTFQKLPFDLTVVKTLPALEWGDVIEFTALRTDPPVQELTVKNLGQNDSGFSVRENFVPGDIRAALLSSATRRITIIDDKEYPLTLRGEARVYDPAKREAPLVSLAKLCALLGVSRQGAPPFTIAVERHSQGTMLVESGSELAESMELLENDRLRIDPNDDATEKAWRIMEIAVVSPGLPMAWRFTPPTFQNPGEADAYAPTLLQFLASFYAPIPNSAFAPVEGHPAPATDEETALRLLETGYIHDRPVLAHPDWAKLRIRRMDLKNTDFEEIITPPLAEVLARLTPEASVEEALRADLPLQQGDIIELPVLKTAQGEWAGLDERMKWLLTKALGLEITIVNGGRPQPVALTYEPPRFATTSVGLLPLAAQPLEKGRVSEMTLEAALRSFFGGNYYLKQAQRRLGEGGVTPLLTEAAFKPELVFVRPGDRLEAGPRLEPTSPAPIRRRQILPAPAASQ